MKVKQWLQRNNYTEEDLDKIVVYTYSLNNKVIFVGRGKLKYAFVTEQFVKLYPKVKNKLNSIVLSVVYKDISREKANNLAKELRIKYSNTIYKTKGHSISGKKGAKAAIAVTATPIYVFDLFGNYITKYKSVRQAKHFCNVSQKTIHKCAKGIITNSNSYIFSYTKTCIPVLTNNSFKIKVNDKKKLLKVKVK